MMPPNDHFQNQIQATPWPSPSGFISSLLWFLSATAVTIHFDVFGMFSSWLWHGGGGYLDELISILLLWGVPFMIHLIWHLHQRFRTLQRDAENISQLHHRNESILHAVGDGLFGLNGKGQITFVNAAAARMLGTASGQRMEIEPRTLRGAHSDLPADPLSSAMEHTLADGQIRLCAQESFYRTDGTTFPVEYSVTPLDPNQPSAGAVVTFRDITQRLHTEEELNRLAAAVNQTAEMVVIIDPQGNILYVNTAFETMTGHGRHEVIGLCILNLPDGGLGKQWHHQISMALSQGIAFRHCYPAVKKNGSIFHADITWSPVRNRDGAITSHVVVGRDVTFELELERQLRKSKRLEAIGTLAGGVAHDFNNILTAILSYTDLTMDDLDPSSLEYSNLGEVMEAANRAKELVKQLLTFSRRNEQERISLFLSQEIKGTISLLKAALPDKITLEASFSDKEDQVMADPTRIHQMVMNLCTNAAEAMERNGGVIRVHLERILVDQALIERHAALAKLQPGPHMVLSVKDQGVGIAPGSLDRLFEPFFTTKSIGKGSGLGLSVVHGIVQTHEGAIKVDSIEDQGAIFQVFLPVVRNPETTSTV
ncbi:MAG: PAS domain S-box protein [Magnetococcales bacterium]|nr:PAS domain S-box protein [Magnetococcales bacterium]